MTTFNQGSSLCQWEIWQARWQHEDGTAKDRPVVILSSTTRASADDGVWVAKFTKTAANIPFCIRFDKDDPSFRDTGLTDSCYLYVAEARRVPKATLLYRRGRLGAMSALMVGFVMKQALKFQIP